MNLRNKIKGALYGAAIGDALGLGTEFMTRAEVLTYYPEGLRHFDQIIRDAHRSQWKQGDWSNDTDLLIMLIESVIDCGKVDHLDYARKLHEWYLKDPTDVVSIYRWMISDPEWVENPVGTAHRIWVDHNLTEATNECIYRALVSGIVSGDKLYEDTSALLSITHDDTRNVSSAMVIARMVQSLFWEDREADLDELINLCDSIDDRTIPYIQRAKEGSLEDLGLDDPDTFWYTRKAMGAALWALWHCDSPQETLTQVIEAGGDADTNASLAMFVSGLKYGYEKMPREVDKLIQRDRLDTTIDRFCEFIENNSDRLH